MREWTAPNALWRSTELGCLKRRQAQIRTMQRSLKKKEPTAATAQSEQQTQPSPTHTSYMNAQLWGVFGAHASRFWVHNCVHPTRHKCFNSSCPKHLVLDTVYHLYVGYDLHRIKSDKSTTDRRKVNFFEKWQCAHFGPPPTPTPPNPHKTAGGAHKRRAEESTGVCEC